MAKLSNTIRVGILGASGYTGAELLRFLAHHPQIEVEFLTADTRAGRSMGEVYPHLASLDLPDLIKIDEADWSGVDAVFCCLPHATTQEVISELPKHLKIVDLSADFRFADTDVYAQTYGRAHLAPELQKGAVYGLTEIEREAIKTARLVAVPGCYPTGAQLPLIPLVEAGLIDADDIIIDAKSGITGAGRSAKQANLFAEVSEGVHAYAIGSHRHAPEIEEQLSKAAGRRIAVTFTPHLMPINRGLLSTIYVKMADGTGVEDIRENLCQRFADERFVQVVPGQAPPATRHVRGSNCCLIGVYPGRVKGQAILVSAIDNLVKGASGQAIQNMNLMHDIPESVGIDLEPMFP
ncbi:MAG: N-acetyl-gamma-glutamyl-phosphate reductase [Alphaproteobacteria bacterium]